MKIEIWSDIMCPFCYIGKRHFEEALKQFKPEGNIEIEWHSFQLDPTIQTEGKKENVYDYIARRKGMSHEHSVKLHERVVQMANSAGLEYNFDKAIVANSFDAHRIIQLAKEYKKGDEIEEAFFKAYFTEGKDLGDHTVLTEIASWVGLPEGEIARALTSDDYSYKVRQDIVEAEMLGITSVPFFVFDRKYGVAGAQPVEAFVETMKKAATGR